MLDWKNILLKPKNSLEKSIKILHDGGHRIALVVNEQNKLIGTLTDGDVRRALIGHYSMQGAIEGVMNPNPVTAKITDSKEQILSLMNDLEILHMPITDDNDAICGLETLNTLTEKKSYDNPVLIMAGGFGTRLQPLTNNTPKPLLNVGNRPILETIIDQFISQGFHNFFISTHYKSEQIRDYFNNKKGARIKYIHEDTPLGTAGSLGLLPDNLPKLPIIMINGDLLTKVDFEHLLDFHNNNDADATMCVREYDFQVPYGVVNIKGFRIEKIKEKPIHKFFVNAGIYILNKNIINKVDGKSRIDITDLLETELNNGRVNAFPIHEYWLDIGRMEEFEKANKDVASIFNQ
jgi:dTDP-glucose pyrophosphorylase